MRERNSTNDIGLIFNYWQRLLEFQCQLVPDACFHYEGKTRCHNYPGGYSCMPCPAGHKGNHQEFLTCVYPILILNTVQLSGNAPTGTGVEYATEHKQTCEVINPCTDGSNPCSENAECIFLGLAITPPFMCKVSAERSLYTCYGTWIRVDIKSLSAPVSSHSTKDPNLSKVNASYGLCIFDSTWAYLRRALCGYRPSLFFLIVNSRGP